MRENPPVEVRKEIESLLLGINNAWLKGDPDDLRSFFHPDIVIVHPDFRDRTIGCEACINTYRQFVQSALIHDFRCDTPLIDVTETTAVAAYEFHISYEMAGQLYRELGRDIFVFQRAEKGWQATWRTVSFHRVFPASI